MQVAITAISTGDRARITIEIEGLTPLISANPDAALAGKLPEAQYLASLFRIAPDRWGYPADNIYLAVKTASGRDNLGQYLTIEGRLLELTGTPQMRADCIDRRAMEFTYRAEFEKWAIKRILVRYVPTLLTPRQIVEMFDRAGFEVGIGPRRPQRGGNFGKFAVSSYAVRGTTVSRSSPSNEIDFLEGGIACHEDADNTISMARAK